MAAQSLPEIDDVDVAVKPVSTEQLGFQHDATQIGNRQGGSAQPCPPSLTDELTLVSDTFILVQVTPALLSPSPC